MMRCVCTRSYRTAVGEPEGLCPSHPPLVFLIMALHHRPPSKADPLLPVQATPGNWLGICTRLDMAPLPNYSHHPLLPEACDAVLAQLLTRRNSRLSVLVSLDQGSWPKKTPPNCTSARHRSQRTRSAFGLFLAALVHTHTSIRVYILRTCSIQGSRCTMQAPGSAPGAVRRAGIMDLIAHCPPPLTSA